MHHFGFEHSCLEEDVSQQLSIIGGRRDVSLPILMAAWAMPSVGYSSIVSYYRLSQPPLQLRATRPQVFSARSSLHPFAFLVATQLKYFSSQRCLQAVRRLVEVTLRLSCAASKACDCVAENDAPALTMSSREKNIPSVFRLLIISVSLQVG